MDEYRICVAGLDGMYRPVSGWTVFAANEIEAVARADRDRPPQAGSPGIIALKMRKPCEVCGLRHARPAAHLSPDSNCWQR